MDIFLIESKDGLLSLIVNVLLISQNFNSKESKSFSKSKEYLINFIIFSVKFLVIISRYVCGDLKYKFHIESNNSEDNFLKSFFTKGKSPWELSHSISKDAMIYSLVLVQSYFWISL